jgi:phosphate butyryltransferase
MQIRKLEQMLEVLSSRPRKRLGGAWAIDAHTIVAVNEAVRLGLVEATLVGDIGQIVATCREHNVNPDNFTIDHCERDTGSAARVCELINWGRVIS